MTKEKTKRPRISVDLKHLNSDFHLHCLKVEKTSSEVIREMVRQLLIENEDRSFAPKELVPGYDEGERKRFEVRLTESETDGALEMNKVLRYENVPRLLIALLRVAITKMPHFGNSEYMALVESNKQLLSIGRNLNQIARALNKGGETEKLTVDAISLLKERTDSHTLLVSRLLAASIERWGLE